MPSKIDIHIAGDDERRAAHANVHEAWGGATPIEEWIEGRLKSSRHSSGEWWVLTVDGEVLSSLGCYALDLCIGGEEAPAFGWGAVHTRPEARGQGHAEQLCREVQRACRARGQAFGLLFSDIGADYYGRMGFRPIAAEKASCQEPAALAVSGPRAELSPVDPSTCLERLKEWYDAAHPRTDVHLARSADYWRYSLMKEPDTEFLIVGDDLGYVRYGEESDLLYPEEVMLPGADGPEQAAVWRALAALAISRGRVRLGGRLSPPAGVTNAFTRKPLGSLPMVCALDPQRPLPDELRPERCPLYATDHF